LWNAGGRIIADNGSGRKNLVVMAPWFVPNRCQDGARGSADGSAPWRKQRICSERQRVFRDDPAFRPRVEFACAGPTASGDTMNEHRD
jgi:hypothetical protein